MEKRSSLTATTDDIFAEFKQAAEALAAARQELEREKAALVAREQVISECISPLSPNDLDILGMLSERLLVANGFDKDGSVSLCHLCGYSRIAPSRGEAKPGRSPRWNVASEG